MAQNRKNIKEPDLSKVKIYNSTVNKLKKENARKEKFQQTFKMPKSVKRKIYALLGAATITLGALQTTESAFSEIPAPENMCTIAIPNDGAEIEDNGISYEIDQNSFIIISENKALAYDENGNIHKGYVNESDFTGARQITEQEMNNYTICQVTAQSGVNVRSTGAIEDDNIISTVSSQDYVLAYTSNMTDTDGQWVSTLSVNGDNIYEGYIYGDYLEVIRNIDEPEIPENPMVVDTSKAGNAPLNLRYEPDEFTSQNILSQIPNGSIISSLKETTIAGDREWIRVEYKFSDGQTIQGWVASEYLTPYVQKTVETPLYEASTHEDPIQDNFFKQVINKKQEINQSQYNIQVNANGTVTGIDFSSISPNDLRELLQAGIPNQVTKSNETTVNTSQVSGDINFAYIKLGGSPFKENSTFRALNYDNYEEQVKVCEELGIPYGFYYYSTATTIEEAKIELEYIQQSIEDLRQKYDLQHNKLEIVVDVELSDANDRQYKGNIEEQTEAKAYLINGIQELDLSDNVLIYGPMRVMRPDSDRIIDLSYLHSLLSNPDNVNLWICLPTNRNGQMSSSLEEYEAYAEEQGFSVVAYQIVLDGEVIGRIDIDTIKLGHLEKILKLENEKTSETIVSQDDGR